MKLKYVKDAPSPEDRVTEVVTKLRFNPDGSVTLDVGGWSIMRMLPSGTIKRSTGVLSGIGLAVDTLGRVEWE